VNTALFFHKDGFIAGRIIVPSLRMCLYVCLILTNLQEYVKSFLSNLSGALQCHY
jgi:hypothetical protein